jgi:prolyl oligopeptidase
VSDSDDPYAWLQGIEDPKALDWVRARNAEVDRELVKRDGFDKMRTQILEVLDSEARIPFVERMGTLYYNFWRDPAHVRGIWRRATLEEYRKPTPRWETVLDLDAVAATEKENWVWEGVDCLRPDYRRCLVNLSRGGADARVVREFDIKAKAFVPGSNGGFELPEAKSNVSWLDADTLLVGTDFGPGSNSMTSSGYPRLVKLWKRGTKLAAAATLFEAQASDVDVFAYRDHTPGFERDFVQRDIAFFASEKFLRGKDGKLVRIELPPDAILSVHREWMLVRLRSDWTVGGTTYAGGSLLATPFEDFIAGKRELTVLFKPTKTISLDDFSWTRHHLLLATLQDVASHIEILTPQTGEWKRAELTGLPPLCSASASGTDATLDDEFFTTVQGFLTPETLSRGDLKHGHATVVLKQAPTFFDSSGLQVQQFFVASKDGTRVPYFVIGPKGSGAQPTLLTGYGGFEISWTPAYDGMVGRAWLARGGVFAVANIRGGGEYGPAWHEAALKKNRLRAYEDFAAVARDLVTRGITTKAQLGARGGSNGGLLMGNMLTLYPELFSAIVCDVPLLDMQRYTTLSAGASWIAEYGDPTKPDEWAYIKTFSPYENVRAGVKYPPVLFTTSTRDDRVGPVHARKMTAKLLALGADARLYENIEGGHGAAANHAEQAFMAALRYTFLSKELRK